MDKVFLTALLTEARKRFSGGARASRVLERDIPPSLVLPTIVRDDAYAEVLAFFEEKLSETLNYPVEALLEEPEDDPDISFSADEYYVRQRTQDPPSAIH